MTTEGPPREAEGRAASVPEATGLLGMRLFLLSLGILFAASLIGYLVVRARAPEWPPAGSPGLPAGLWLSTGLILASSLSMWRGQVAARGHRAGALSRNLLITFVLGVAFLISQTLNWSVMGERHLIPQASLFAFTFYVLTALHGLHVVGGLIPMGITTVRSGRGRYTAESHAGVRYVAMYWHFLDVVWIVLFVALTA